MKAKYICNILCSTPNRYNCCLNKCCFECFKIYGNQKFSPHTYCMILASKWVKDNIFKYILLRSKLKKEGYIFYGK
jgi:hypothetical protein